MHATKNGHCYGYHVTLWQHTRSVVCFLAHSESMCGDTPTRRLENVKLDLLNETLSFTTRVSTECTLSDNGVCIPSTKLIRFKGNLTKAGLAGTATWYGKDGKESFRKDRLRMKQIRTPTIRRYKDLQEWEADMHHLLARTPARR